jgi:hypothetical protein
MHNNTHAVRKCLYAVLSQSYSLQVSYCLQRHVVVTWYSSIIQAHVITKYVRRVRDSYNIDVPSRKFHVYILLVCVSVYMNSNRKQNSSSLQKQVIIVMNVLHYGPLAMTHSVCTTLLPVLVCHHYYYSVYLLNVSNANLHANCATW